MLGRAGRRCVQRKGGASSPHAVGAHVGDDHCISAREYGTDPGHPSFELPRGSGRAEMGADEPELTVEILIRD